MSAPPRSSRSSEESVEDDYLPSREPVQDFTVDYTNQDQNFHGFKRLWQQRQRPPPQRIRALMEWSYRRAGGTLQHVGQRFADLWYSRLDIGDDDDWFFTEALGRGGFGAVALFEKQSAEDGSVDDEIVVKTTEASLSLAVNQDRLDLAMEAALMGQTNEVDDDGMMRLRNFKFYRLQNQWRFYFEYCPFGDLERLRIRYKAYGRYFPELFLWHTFYWLANTLNIYKNHEPWRSTETATWGKKVDQGWLLHCDIKTQNVLLGPPDPKLDDVSLYPIPRMADLGLAEIIDPRSRRYGVGFHRNGTTYWQAPEFHYLEVDKDSDFYPFDNPQYIDPNKNNPHRKGYHPVRSAANIWSVGAIMFSLMSLKEANFLHNKILDILEQKKPVPHGPQESLIGHADFDLIPPQQYSDELVDLVLACLRFQPDHRPSEAYLVQCATDGYLRNLQPLHNLRLGTSRTRDDRYECIADAVDNDPKYAVYYQQNEIDAADDNYEFDHPGRTDRWWKNYFVEDLMWVPEHWGRLWPDDMPLDVDVPLHWPVHYLGEFEQKRQMEMDMQDGPSGPESRSSSSRSVDMPAFARMTLNETSGFDGSSGSSSPSGSTLVDPADQTQQQQHQHQPPHQHPHHQHPHPHLHQQPQNPNPNPNHPPHPRPAPVGAALRPPPAPLQDDEPQVQRAGNPLFPRTGFDGTTTTGIGGRFGVGGAFRAGPPIGARGPAQGLGQPDQRQRDSSSLAVLTDHPGMVGPVRSNRRQDRFAPYWLRRRDGRRL